MRGWRLVGILATALFVVLAVAVYFAPEAVNAVDAWAGTHIAPFQTLVGIQTFLALSVLGSGIGIIAIGIGFAYIGRLSAADTLRLIFLLTAVSIANKFLKEFFLRARPDPLTWFDALPSFSFPSAHASAAVALYGFIAVLLYRKSRRVSYVLIPGLAILLVGMSRIVIGAHYFSDVAGGYLLGAAILALALLLPLERLTERHG